jgi:hypothetical protein
MRLNDLIGLLNLRGVIVWPLHINGEKVFVSKDFETGHRGLIWASQLGHANAVTLFFNVNYSIKVYREEDLYRIAAGFLAHDAYEGILKLTLPRVEGEVKVYDNELRIVGVADLVLDDNVVEVKLSRKYRSHRLQLAAYMRALKVSRGYLVYPNDVVEVEHDEGLSQELVKAVEGLDRLRRIVLNHDLDYIVSKFTHSYVRFKQTYGVEPKELAEVLRGEGFI